MFSNINRSIAGKILATVSLVILLLFGGTMWYSSEETNRTLQHIQQESNLGFGEFVHRTLEFSMESNNNAQLQSLISEGAQAQGIDALRVINSEGKIAYSSRIKEAGSMVVNPEELEILDRVARAAGGIEQVIGEKAIVAIPLRADAKCVRCHDSLGKYLGAIVVVRDVAEQHLMIKQIHFRTVWYFIAALVFTVLIMHGLLRYMVLGPLFKLLDTAQSMAHGDLSHDVGHKGEDEVGQLAEAFRTMQEHLRRSLAASQSVALAINTAVDELDNSSEDLVTVAMEQSSGAAEQAASVHEVTSTAQEIAATSSQISSNLESIRGVAEETYRACVRGRDDVKNAVNGMETVKDKVRAIADSTVELGRKSQKIGNVISIIDEISEQTHLLALNAAIEAAGAGEHGKRFSVVASEVRRLAERTVDATTEIKSLIEEIQDSTNETVMITERGASIVLEGASKVDLIGESLEELLALVLQTKDAAKEMAVATQQQALAGDQLVMTISDINGVAVQVSRAAEQVEKSVMRLKNIAHTMKELSERNREYEKFKV